MDVKYRTNVKVRWGEAWTKQGYGSKQKTVNMSHALQIIHIEVAWFWESQDFNPLLSIR